jgi:uncharacterized protein (TIGR00375 family)
VNYTADLHIHSHYSRATSKASHLHGLAAWAAVKGIAVVGTGDFTHPGWFAHLHDSLEPAEPGFFRLKSEPGRDWSDLLPPGIRPARAPESVRFVFSAEISSIYKRGGQVRKVHNLLYAPDLDSVRRVNATLATLGNLTADGRPILGLDSRDLLEILLEQAPEGFLVPAHIWTPWFSLFGSKSGFDRIEDCFGDLSDHIFALETGLSSDPEMNRLISALDRFTLISNSDCHSPAKLGREANLFATEFDYFALRDALRSPVNAEGTQVLSATVEFYPEEGKYHCDGHRKCQVCLEPAETRTTGGLCPRCGKPLTIGVLHRVMELADRDAPLFPPGSPQVHSLIPLQEMVAELLDCGPASKKAMEGYARLITLFGSEFDLLLDTPLDEIKAKGFGLLAEAIERVRTSRVHRQPGYDGEFGVIRVFSEGERAELCGQTSLFGSVTSSPRQRGKRARLATVAAAKTPIAQPAGTLNSEQQGAVDSEARLILVQAGPGTGKTHTLVSRVRRTVACSPLPCTVITFTNKAADEVRERLRGVTDTDGSLTVATFHGYCLAQLRRFHPELRVVGPEERILVLEELYPRWSGTHRHGLSAALSLACREAEPPAEPDQARYFQRLAEQSLVDLDALVPQTVTLLRQGGEAAAAVRKATGHLFVDEFQDVNQAQYTLVALLAETATVFAIGDPDQAVYGFRGADPRWFHAFIADFHPECHQLVRNYRSGGLIVRAAEQLIRHNPHPHPMAPMQALSTAPGQLHQQRCAIPVQEAAFIADQIELQMGGTSHRSLERFDHAAGPAAAALRDIGILYRTSRQAEAIGTVLGQRGIPFQLVDLEAFYTRGDCRLLYLWLLLLAGLAEPGQVLTLLEREPGMDRQGLEAMQASLGRYRTSETNDLLADVMLPGTAALALDRFRALLAKVQSLVATHSLETVLSVLMESCRLDPNQPDLIRLREMALTFGSSLPAFAAHLHRFSDGVLYDPRAEAVTLSTLHAAKGLEFPVVFMAGVEDGLLPLTPRRDLAADTLQAHLEEERRLFYVGMTRAMRTLYLTWCRSRSLYGGRAEERQPSPLLTELPSEVFSPPPVVKAAGKRTPAHRQLSLFS